MPATVLPITLNLPQPQKDPQRDQPLRPRITGRTLEHTYFEDRPDWDAFGITFSTLTTPPTGELNQHQTLLVAAQGLVLPNKVNLRQKTHGHLFPIELGGPQTDKNSLLYWSGPNYAIPLRALASRTMALQPTFNHKGWQRQRAPLQGLMARLEVIRRVDDSISHIRITAWTMDITSGEASDETATTWDISNRL